MIDLHDYTGKRDFGATPEPVPEAADAPHAGARFVIQRHDARALHFDLRLEADGVLHSWALPKGVPLRVGPKRLAVQTEPHPVSYLAFSGVIPAGQYGAGLITIWDEGTFETLHRSADEWKVVLSGTRLRGEYHLVHTSRDRGFGWLLFRSERGEPGPPDPAPRFRALRPMLATQENEREAPLDDGDWAVELKWDGFRALALIGPDGTHIRSREGNDLAARFPPLGDLRRGVDAQEVILDGEIVVLDDAGRADFGRLQCGEGPPRLMVFDALYVDGEWLCDRPWDERAAIVARIVLPDRDAAIARSDFVTGSGWALLALARERGVEGVVAKRRDSTYVPGERSPHWIKVKTHREQDVVVGGYTEGDASRRGRFGALLVGIVDDDGRLRFAGQVGGGFADLQLTSIAARLRAMPREEPPFVDAPTGRNLNWVEPILRCRVRFSEWTRDGRMRSPVFAGLLEGRSPDAPARAEEATLRDGGREVRLTNLNKPFWPALALTKGDLIDHYLRVGPTLVPHIAERALILKRYPDGWSEPHFFQHAIPDTAPSWMTRAALPHGGRADAELVTYTVVDDVLGLLWMVNLGCIDVNPLQSLAARPDEPTHVLIDLDPADGLPFSRVVETALVVKETLDELGLRGYPKTSGASGMHIYIPILPNLPAAAVTDAASVIASHIVARHPSLVTVARRVADRGPRVYIDAGQNGAGRSIAAVYSVRPVAQATVSTPLAWGEVDESLDPRAFTMGVVARRLAVHGDLFAPVLTDSQDLRDALGRR